MNEVNAIVGKWVRLAGVAALVTGIAACSSGSKSSKISTTTTPPAPVTAVFRGRATLTGAVDVAGDFTAEHRSENVNLRSCAQLASIKGRKAFFVVPSPSKLGKFDVALVASALPYSGPGTYSANRLSQLQAAVRPALTKEFREFTRTRGSTATLRVGSDGSGSFRFAGLKDSKGATLSGTVSWRCANR